jgi:propionyl-CoA carboxylase beta chain
MGPQGAVEIIFKEEIEDADDPEAAKQHFVEEYREKVASPLVAASRGYIDDIIRPRDTRQRLVTALELLKNKRDSNPPKKHGNIPL